MSKILRHFLTLCLVLSLTPGSMELLENLEHLIHDGHLAHVVSHDEDEDVAAHDALDAEHGCTPMTHTCGCHTSVPVLLSYEMDLDMVIAVVTMREGQFGLQDHILRPANAPPRPPPRV